MATGGHDRSAVFSLIAPGIIPRVAIIGCGNIGCRWEGECDAVWTHAAAWQGLEVELAAVAEPDPKLRSACAKRYGIAAQYADWSELFAAERIDILSLATPTPLRRAVIEASLTAGVRALWCEKPLATTLAEAMGIRDAVKAAGAILAVNYLRRWDPGIERLAACVRAGELGEPRQVVGRYTKGLLNNGSHLLDLLQICFGTPQRMRVLRVCEDDYSPMAPSLDVQIEYTDGHGTFPAYLLCTDQRDYALFELDILGSCGRIELCRSGCELRQARIGPDPNFPGYQILYPPEPVAGALPQAMRRAAAELLALWRAGGGQPRCTVDDGVAALRVVETLRRAQATNSWQSLVEQQIGP